MRLWHNTEDAPRLPHRVLEGERVEVWVASYPIGLWHHVMVDWKVTHRNGKMESGSVPAFCPKGIPSEEVHDLSLCQNLWLAHLGPFLEGDSVEYVVAGVSCDEDFAPQVFKFTIEEEEKNNHGERPRVRNEHRRALRGSYQHV
ncbi:MAG: hypothetical protein HY961_14565 [Ignavibacteriae bacterium]|nr:hypothetical protein [Ignavibacteriota bacterium]